VKRELAELLGPLSEERRAEVLAQLDAEEIAQLELGTEGLLGFIPKVSPELSPPRHLQPLVDLIESTLERPRKIVVSTPPQHGKTETCTHGLAWLIKQNPARRHAYATYETGRAQQVSQRTREICTAAGISTSGSRKLWRFPGGGSVFATGVDGPLTGQPVDGLLLIDDPVKNRAEAESSTYRARADDWLKSVARTRMHPSASCIVVHTRWHPDDLAGRLIDRGWEKIQLPAIDEHGKPLWPEGRPLSFLEEMRADIGEYEWASLFQCVPRARGAAVFGDSHLFELAKLNLTGFRFALGVDTAYTAKKTADWSVALVLAESGGLYYVIEVVRVQTKTPQFNSIIAALKKKWGIRRTRWYTNTVEQGVADMIDVTSKLAKEDKFVRAQPVSAAWNAGKVLVPRDQPWANLFTSEIVSFTGVDDDHDDQVDALAAAYDELANGGVPTYSGLPRAPTSRRM
jgi:predicted phage terminase large subunit-like protein